MTDGLPPSVGRRVACTNDLDALELDPIQVGRTPEAVMLDELSKRFKPCGMEMCIDMLKTHVKTSGRGGCA